jgi:hypothetical protein
MSKPPLYEHKRNQLQPPYWCYFFTILIALILIVKLLLFPTHSLMTLLLACAVGGLMVSLYQRL